MSFEKFLKKNGVKSIKSMSAEQYSAFCNDIFTLRRIQNFLEITGVGCCIFDMIDIRNGNAEEFYITEAELRSTLK